MSDGGFETFGGDGIALGTWSVARRALALRALLRVCTVLLAVEGFIMKDRRK